VQLPDAVGAEAGAALGCRFATAFRAVTAHAAVRAGQEVAVFGCGGVGLSAVMIASALGARVTAVDVSTATLHRARELGAATAIRSGANVVEDVVAATAGGAHATIDALGSAQTSAAAVRSLRPRGTHVQVGLMLGEASGAPLPWDRVVGWELSVVGSHGMPAVDYPAMLAMLEQGTLDPTRLVGSVVDLEGSIEALVGMDSPQPEDPGGIVIVRP
jgi:alcohol dehydrogenase